MNYEIEMLLNIQSGFTEKPQSQTGLLAYPRNYMTNFWNVIRVKRLKDNVIIYKNFTKTDKGDVLFIKIECFSEYQRFNSFVVFNRFHIVNL